MTITELRAAQKAARPVYAEYKAGRFWDQPYSCGHVHHYRAIYDKQLKPLTFERWVSEYIYDSQHPCTDCISEGR